MIATGSVLGKCSALHAWTLSHVTAAPHLGSMTAHRAEPVPVVPVELRPRLRHDAGLAPAEKTGRRPRVRKPDRRRLTSTAPPRRSTPVRSIAKCATPSLSPRNTGSPSTPNHLMSLAESSSSATGLATVRPGAHPAPASPETGFQGPRRSFSARLSSRRWTSPLSRGLSANEAYGMEAPCVSYMRRLI